MSQKYTLIGILLLTVALAISAFAPYKQYQHATLKQARVIYRQYEYAVVKRAPIAQQYQYAVVKRAPIARQYHYR